MLTRFVCFAFVALFIAQSTHAQEEDDPKRGSQFSLLLNVDSPVQSIMPDMSTTGLFGFGFGQSPFFGSPMFIEFKALWGNYSRETQNDVYYEKSGWLYPADSRYASGYQKYLLGTKFMVGKDFRTVRAFGTPQIGLLRMRSKVTINWTEDGTVDQNGLGPNEAHRTVIAETGFIYGGEAGLEFAINKLLKVPAEDNVFRLVLSASYLMGTKEYSFADVDHLISTPALPDNGLNYIQASHPKQWEQYSTEVHSSSLAMWGVNVGIIINF